MSPASVIVALLPALVEVAVEVLVSVYSATCLIAVVVDGFEVVALLRVVPDGGVAVTDAVLTVPPELISSWVIV